MNPEDIQARVLHRDGLILIVDKPAGLPVHRGPKGGASFEDYFDALRYGLPRRPSLAHRLDRGASGCLLLGRHHKALEKLGRLFKSGAIDKTYWAVVEGAPADEAGLIDLPLARRDPTRGWWMKVDSQGAPSQSLYRVLTSVGAGAERLTLLELKPLTGRTHQLRVHCAAMGFPILGDDIYGHSPRQGGPQLHLHARAVAAPMSANKAPVRAQAPLPPHFLQTFADWGAAGRDFLEGLDAADASAISAMKILARV